MWLRPWAIGILSPTGQRQPFIIYIIKPKAAQQGAANASAWECGKNSIHNHYHAISTCGCLSAYVLVQYLNYPVCQSKAYSKAVLEPWASLRLLRAQMVKICKNHIALNCHVKTLPLDISLVLCLYVCPVYSGHFASNAAGCWLKHWNFKGQQKPSHFCIGFPSPSPDRARNWGSTGASSRITINLGFSWERMYIVWRKGQKGLSD